MQEIILSDFSVFGFYSPSYKFSTISCLCLVKCVDSNENLCHCCGLKGYNLPLRPHMMPGEANDGAKFQALLKIPQKLKNLKKSSVAFF